MTDVVAALIWENDRFLLCRRPADKSRPLLWELAGGKVEPGETREQALVRECREELDISVEPEEVFCEAVHDYPDLTIRLTVFRARIAEGTPRLKEHCGMIWASPAEAMQMELCPADREVISRL